MTTRSSEGLVHPRVRSAFREASSNCGVVKQIERAFQDESLAPPLDSSRDWHPPG